MKLYRDHGNSYLDTFLQHINTITLLVTQACQKTAVPGEELGKLPCPLANFKLNANKISPLLMGKLFALSCIEYTVK